MRSTSLFDSTAAARLQLESAIRHNQKAAALSEKDAALVLNYCRWLRRNSLHSTMNKMRKDVGLPLKHAGTFLQTAEALRLYKSIADEIGQQVGFVLLQESEINAVAHAIHQRKRLPAGAVNRTTLHVGNVQKFTSNGKRMIRGLANSGLVDRVGDVVEPKGGQWSLPVPLLWQHKHDTPIGWVRSIEVRSDGLWITAELAEGIGKADEAWRMIEVGLVDSYSIGFRAHDWDALPDGGKRFTSWTLLEISVVTVPADARAKIRRGMSSSLRAVQIAKGSL